MKPKYPTNKGFTLIELLVVMTIIAVLAGVGFQAFTKAQETSRITAATSHLKDIYNALLQYAQDNGDRYPYKDPKGGNEFANSNEAFRELFRENILSDENVFEVSPSPAVLDGYIGESPEYIEALKQGECHWALVRGASISSSGAFPLVWENSLTGGWDPQWDPKLDVVLKGRTWSNARVLILSQGGGAKLHKLDNKETASRLQNLGTGSRNVFTQSGQKDSLDPLGLD